MWIWLSLVAGIAAGTCVGCRPALTYAWRDEFAFANRWLRCGACVAAITAMVGVSVFLHWPFLARTETVSEEVKRTVVEIVEVPVQVTRWFFWKVTVYEPQEVEKEVTSTVELPITVVRFSGGMVLPWIMVGAAAYLAQLWLIRIAWRFGY